MLAALDRRRQHPDRRHGGTLNVLAASLGVALGPEHMHNASPLVFRARGGRRGG
ncbi:MAG: hypothetical protein WDO24_12950 [Pseudomonadota bacterium]